MSTFATDQFRAAFAAIPCGVHRVTFEGRDYVLRKQLFAGGKSVKLVAEELGGNDYISLNLYHLASGDLLKPCEMSDEKVIRFVTGLSLT